MKRTLLTVLLLASAALVGCTFQDLTNRIPEAVIDASPREGQAPLTVQFDARYSHDDGPIAEYYWDFGDPHDTMPLSSSSTTMHTYRYPDTYLAKLTVIDEKGELDSEMITIKVTNPPPVASFEVSTEFPRAWVLATFDASTSYDSNGEIVSYTWDFGDGNTGSGVSTNHAYTKEGSYTVILAVTDNEGETATIRRTITVQQGGGGCGGGTCDDYGDPPLAVISGLPSCQGGTVDVSIRFDGSYSRAAEGTIVRYEWDFGDGETATGAIVRHAYEHTGRYEVILTVHDNSGRQASTYGCFIEIHTNSYY